VVSIEAGATFGWAAIADVALGIDRFGLSAPAPEVFTALGITTQHLITTVHAVLSERGAQ
jgi:transketolase